MHTCANCQITAIVFNLEQTRVVGHLLELDCLSNSSDIDISDDYSCRKHSQYRKRF